MNYPGNPNSPAGGTLYGAPSPYASLPPIAIPPAPPPAKGSPVGLIVGVIAGVAIVAGGVTGAVVLLRKGNVHALPVDAAMLPAHTLEVGTQLIEATRETDERVKAPYLAAELGAEFCRAGARNPAQVLEGLQPGYAKPAKDFFWSEQELTATRSLLECGALLGNSLESPYQAGILFETEEKVQRQVGIGHFKIAEIPPKFGFTRYTFDGVPGFCSMDSGGGTECGERSLGGFAQGTTWFLGQRPALEGIAGRVKRPKEELNASLSALKEAANQTEGLPVMRLSTRPKSSKDFFTSPCLFGALHSAAPITEFLDGCFPAKQLERSLQEIDAKVKAAAYETDGDPQKAGAFHGNLIFVARDNHDAKEVERDVKDVVNEWHTHLDTNEPKLINQSRENPTTSRTKKFAAVVNTYFKSLRRAKVERDGRTIRVSFREVLSPEDLTALEEADKTTIEKRVAVAEVLAAVQAKRDIPEASLAKLTGAAWAKYLLSPPPSPTARIKKPMKVADCKTLQLKIRTYKMSDFSTTDAALMFANQKYASCSTRPPEVDEGQSACLATFKTPAEYAKCASPGAAGEPPESEFAARAKK